MLITKKSLTGLLIALNKMLKAIIKTGYTCNNNCLFCHAIPKRKHGDLNLAGIKNKILLCKKMGVKMVLLSGGEPTIRNDLFLIVKFISENNLRFGIITNGRMLGYPNFLEKLIDNSLQYAYISIHGSNATIHDSITKTESFNQTLNGIRGLSGRGGIEVIVNYVVIKQNLEDLKNIADILKEFNINKLKFSFVEPITLSNPDDIPNIKTAADHIKDAMKYAISQNLNTGFDGIPLCLMKGYEGLLDNLQTNNIRLMSESYEDKFYRTDQGNKTKVKGCKKCSLFNDCEGIYKTYCKKYGNEELVPFKQNGAKYHKSHS